MSATARHFQFVPGEWTTYGRFGEARVLQARWYPDGNWYLINYRPEIGDWDQKLVRETDLMIPPSIATFPGAA